MERWRDQRTLTISSRTLDDYRDIFDAEDLKHAPQIHEHEFNPFLLHDPKFQELHKYEAERGVERMRMFILLQHSTEKT